MTRHPKRMRKASRFPETIPPDLVCEVLGRVAATSLTDVFSAEMSCKTFKEIAEDISVYQRISLDKIPVIPWRPLSNGQEGFLNKCRQYENPELMYRQAVIDYFDRANPTSACINLQNAKKLGHEALYLTDVLFLLRGDDESKQKGIKLLGSMRNKKLRMCRNKLGNVLNQMWVKNPVLLHRPICCTTRNQHRQKIRWLEEEVECEACIADREIKYICSCSSYNIFS